MFKALLSRFKAPLKEQTIEAYKEAIKNWQSNYQQLKGLNVQLAGKVGLLELVIDGFDDDLRLSRLEVIELQDQQLKDKREIEALKAIVSNLRKQKVYAGQKFYDQNDHRAPTVYLCARFNQWYMVRQSNEAVPKIMHAERWQETYGHLVVLPQMNSNLKNIL